MTTPDPRPTLPPYALPLLLALIVLLAFAVGWGTSVALHQLEIPLPLRAIALPGGLRLEPLQPAATRAAEEVDLGVFWEAMALLDKNYYAQEELPRAGALTYAAVEGVIAATGDPHSSFMTPADATRFEQSLDGTFEGIGARVDMGEAGLIIVSPYPDTPAAKAGLEPGDVVLEVDGQVTQGMALEEAIALVRGEKGSTVRLTIQRDGEAEIFTVDVVRDSITIPVVLSRLIEAEGLPPVGYLHLTEFGRTSTAQVKGALRELQAQGAEALILDLRYNPGGLLDASVEISSQFIDEGLILSERTAYDINIDHPARGGGLALDIPLVVLINEGSASASEILAGAIKDSGRGTLIGTTSFGKGSVQRLHHLSDDSLLRVTVARWFTPEGNAIHEVGIVPDIEVTDPEDVALVGGDEDPVILRALDWFRSQNIAPQRQTNASP